MSAVIVYTDAGFLRSYLSGADAAGQMTWVQNQADAKLFADGAAATAFLVGKDTVGGETQLAVTGGVNYGLESANQ